MPTSQPHAIVVVGAGMAGLAAAEALLDRSPRPAVTIIEPSGRVGGVVGTVRDGDWLVERSADNVLVARPEAVDMVRRLGLEEELVSIPAARRRALVWHAGRGVPAPRGFRLLAPGRLDGVLTTPLLSMPGRLRLLAEPLVRRGRGGDESLESFAVRRLGREAFERLVQPLAAGIWTADPSRLGMEAACPEFLQMEREHGSLWAGERARLRRTGGAAATGARYGQFVALASGMETLPRRLAERLAAAGATFLTDAATGLERTAAGWRVQLASGAVRQADAVVVAVPAPVASRLVAAVDHGLAVELAAIDYAGSAVVCLGYRRDQIGHPLDAAGMVVPRTAGRRALAVSFSSEKFPGRAPAGCVLVRLFVGGALDPAVLDMPDAAIVELARKEAGVLLAAHGEPLLQRLERWQGTMPQYHVGHLDRVARIEAAVTRHPGLALAGAAYRGVGIPQVIASGQAAAAAVSPSRQPD